MIDCAYYGMFLRAEDGVVSVADSTSCVTKQRAAIRFWGEAAPCDSLSFSATVILQNPVEH